MSDDNTWRDAAQMLAASNAQLCDRLLTAEAVVEEARRLFTARPFRTDLDHLKKAIAAHDAGRPS